MSYHQLDDLDKSTDYRSTRPEILYTPPIGPPPQTDDKSRYSKAYFETNQPPVQKWPVHSQKIWAMTPLRLTILFFDVVLASTPIMFIALSIVAASLNGREITEYGLQLQRVLLLSPTIFPIIFAALMGRSFKYFGLYRAERGISLGRLEQLVGCQSLFSALERQISLRSWSVLGMLMAIVWLLSPIGGQSALRLLDIQQETTLTNGTYHYLDPNAIQSSFLQGASASNSGRSTFVSLFLAALLSSPSYQATPMDLWGNVKIPAYRSVVNSSSSDWKSVDHSKNVTYASLIGIPIAGIEASGNSTFNVKTRQWDVTCDGVKELSFEDSDFGNITTTWKLNYTDGRCNGYPCPITLKSLDKADNYSVATCELSYESIEAVVSCNRTLCQTDYLRKLDLLGDDYGQDTDAFVRLNMVTIEMSLLPAVDQKGVVNAGARASSNAEKWMQNPWNFIGAIWDNVELYKLPPDVLGERLTIIWNTFWQSTYATTALAGNLPQNLTELAAQDPSLTFNSTEVMRTSEPTDVYKTNWRWFVALLVCSIVLQVAAYTGLVLKYITLAPDIIGYASSLTIMNPYIPTPTGGTTLHGLERAAVLHDIPIRIGDVCGQEPVGAIAVARADDTRVARLSRNRYYI